MAAYILRRLLLIIPTLFGMMLINFLIIQFVPGGPIEQLLSQLEEGAHGGATERFSGGGDGGAAQTTTVGSEGQYRGRKGIEEELIKELEKQYGLDKPIWERFGIMLWNYARFDFGESYQRSETVINIILEKMPVSITLGLWATLISYLVSIPLGIRKAIKDGSPFDTATSGVIIAAYSLPAFLVPVVLLVMFAGGSYWQWFPLRGLHSDNFDDMTFWQQVGDYFHHIALPVLAMTISGFATLTLLTKNSFLDEIGKQYVLTARSKGLTENRVLFGHVFRNAMLIVIAGFPAAFVSVFFAGSIFVESVFSLDGLGLLSLEAVIYRDYPIILGSLFMFGLLGLVMKLITDLVYVWIDPRIDFEKREG